MDAGAMPLTAVIQRCAPQVHPRTLQAIVRVESGGNPYAIGVIGGALERQPRSLGEAVATAAELERLGMNYDLGLAQINRANLQRLGLLPVAHAFDACANLRASAAVLTECFGRAKRQGAKEQGRSATSDQASLHAAISCYYSGSLTRGFVPRPNESSSYVERVLAAAHSLRERSDGRGCSHGQSKQAQPTKEGNEDKHCR